MAKGSQARNGNIDISGTVDANQTVIGHGNKVTYSEVSGNTFAPVREAIERRPEDPKVDKEELTATVDRIEKEAAKGAEADESKLDRWIGFVADMAPDVWDVLIATLTNPIAGLGMVARKVAIRSKEARASAAPTIAAAGPSSAT